MKRNINREILVYDGVPETAVHILPEFVVDTEQEVEEAAREMRRTGKTKIIIVTSPQHTRRVKALWEKLVGDNPAALVHAAHDDPFDISHWWRNTRDIFSVVRETLGLVNVGGSAGAAEKRLSAVPNSMGSLQMGERACDLGLAQCPGKDYAGERKQNQGEQEQRANRWPELRKAGARQQRLPHAFE